MTTPASRPWIGLMLWLGLVLPVRATELVTWRQVPVPVQLVVGQERVLEFPDHVQVGVPAELMAGQFRSQSTGGTVLWLAHQPFATARVQVRVLRTGAVMLFDVTAIEAEAAGPSEPLRITAPGTRDDEAQAAAGAASSITPISLTRFAAQQLYAPRRLLKDLAGVRRVPMRIAASVALYRGAPLVATPLASWQAGALYVTAVKLTNQGAERVWLDPRALRGQFLAATFQHNVVGAAGSRTDATCVYLITARPLAVSVWPAEAGGA